MTVQTELGIVILMCVASELLGQAWMKPDKGNRAPHVLLVSKRFNEVVALHIPTLFSDIWRNWHVQEI